MKTCFIDGRTVDNPQALHQRFARSLDFPRHYGGNLDALFDCLGDMEEVAHIHIVHFRQLDFHLGDYARRLCLLLWRAARENPRIHLCICSDD